ncbi:MAG: class I SAM-dependent methyltransferase [Pseudomonadales bacterium]|nr:class I SAM-dependent methyltransferase [Pseudomonadales bacterium]
MTGKPTSLVFLQQKAKASDTERELAQRLQLELVQPTALGEAPEFGYVLELTDAGLGLRGMEKETRGTLRVDFAAKSLQRRVQQSVKSQDIGKAVGLTRQSQLRVLDATAGLGTDAFLLASAGCEVTLLERSAIVYALLQDGVSRARETSSELRDVVSRITLAQQDFLRFQKQDADFDVVYLDPMFPAKRNRARAKKAMFFLQQLLDEPSDEALLLAHARSIANSRVVVKRARLAPLAGGQQPDIQFKGSSSRFDVYLIR